MIEKTIKIEGVDPRELFGAQDIYLDLIRDIFPALRIVARSSTLKVLGEEHQLELFEKQFRQFVAYYEKYGHVSKEVIMQCFSQGFIPEKPSADNDRNILLYGTNGNIVRARTANQQRLATEFESNDMIFAIGPAGSGKTYTAIALAVRALKNKQVRRVILTRPAVEAGEKLGFLPGDMKEKLDPYLQPLYDALNDMIPAAKLSKYMEEGAVQIAPLAYMRGRTLDNAVVILDEAQNTTLPQIKMFLTRMGRNAKFIVTGDVTQIDLPRSADSGLMRAMKMLGNIEGIAAVEFDRNDIVRHPLVKHIVAAFERQNDPDAGKPELHLESPTATATYDSADVSRRKKPSKKEQ